MTALAELDRMILLSRDHIAPTLSDEEICQQFQSFKVLCVSDLHNLSSHSGQTVLFTLVALLSRMGMQVGLNLPDTAVLLANLHLLFWLSLVPFATAWMGENRFDSW